MSSSPSKWLVLLAAAAAISSGPTMHARASQPTAAEPHDLHVAPDGRDGWSGRLARPNAAGTDGPLATLGAARDAARKLNAATPRRILIRPGNYHLPEPLVLGPADSGLSIQGAGDEPVMLSGGRRITGWKRDGRFWSAELPEVARGEWDFRLLIVNGRFAPRARLPGEGFFRNLNHYQVPSPDEPRREPAPELLTHMIYRAEDLGTWLDLKNAEITVYHGWDESLVGLAGLDEATRTIRFSTPTGYPPGSFDNPGYVVWNVREGLQEPGQWFLDRTGGQVVYRPLDGEDVDSAEILAPVPQSLIVLRGSQAQPVRDVVLQGLQLTVSNTRIAPSSFGARNVAAAVELESCRNVRLDGLRFFNISGHAIKGSDCERIAILGCDIHDTGAGGIILDGNDIILENNLIHHIGLIHPSGVGIWALGTPLVIRHNELHDLPYSGIVTERDDHLIEANRIERVMQELQDGGAIYTGENKGVVIRGNFVGGISGPGGRHAYYIDERGSDAIIEGNVSVGVAWPWHNHIGRNNLMRNNIAIADGDLKITFTRSSGYTLQNNVIVAGGDLLIQGAPEAIVRMPNNVFFSGTGRYEFEKLDNYTRAGRSAFEPKDGSVAADPKLLRPSPTMFRFAPDSPCPPLGISPVDVSNAGRKGLNRQIPAGE